MSGPKTLEGLSEAQRRARLAYLELDAADRKALAELGAILRPQLGAILTEWHAFLHAQQPTRRLLPRRREHLRRMQTRYFDSLLAAPHDATYFQDRLRVGRVHEQIGLLPVWYTGAYRKLMALVRTRAAAQATGLDSLVRWMGAFEKAVQLDMQLALDAYQEAHEGRLLNLNQELRELAEQLEQRNLALVQQMEKTQEVARLKEEFLAQVSHELRTPLHAVLGYADLLRDGIDGPLNRDQQDSVARIHRHGRRLLTMIEQMIEAAKLSAAGVQEAIPFDPQPILAALAAQARTAAVRAGLDFTLEVPADLPWVEGDPEGLRLALGQLLDNAVRFTVQGGVRLTASRAGTWLRLSVVDTGIGIPAEQQEQVFEAFHQVDSGDTRGSEGLGIGLTLARQAVVRMGGRLELAHSGPDGSTFTVELPGSR